MRIKSIYIVSMILTCLVILTPLVGQADDSTGQTNESSLASQEPIESELGHARGASFSIIQRSVQAGPVVFFVLLLLMSLSMVTWAIVIAKWLYLRLMTKRCDAFSQKFWNSKSLNELNSGLGEHPYSPLREVFRTGFSELVRATQLREQSPTLDMAVGAAMDNLSRSLHKAKGQEKRKLENYLPVLAISASAAPFIGLFGTVWGIMNAFEGIAISGSANLSTVAPGISEALIATAFGLAAAIPAAIGYNIANNMIRGLLFAIEGFSADFMNIIERYLVSERSKGGSESSMQSPRI